MDVVGSGSVDAVALVSADAGLAEPGTRSEVAPVAVHWKKKDTCWTSTFYASVAVEVCQDYDEANSVDDFALGRLQGELFL